MYPRVKVSRLTSFLCALLFITFPAMSFNPKSSIQCELIAEKQQSIVNGIKITYQLTNTLAQPVKVLTWYTPLEGFMSNLFEITDSGGHQLAYQGPMFKRTAPEQQDYIEIAPHQSVSITLNLLDAYPFTDGQYQITLRPRKVEIHIDNQSVLAQLCQASNVTISVEK